MVKVKITLIKSQIDRPKDQKATLSALGLNKVHSSRIHVANPALMGMIKKVSHLIKIEEVAQ